MTMFEDRFSNSDSFRSARSRSVIGSGVLLALMMFSGCVREDARFSNREEFDKLIPEAQEYVGQVLDKHFGTPTKMVVWEKLPLKLHAAVGKVEAGATSRAIPVEFTSENLHPMPGMEVSWLSGALLQKAGTPDILESLGSDQMVHLKDPGLSQLPVEGDRVAIGPGEVLKQGRLLYAEHCLHCHGVSGDAMGPTAPYLNPRPRDFRRGIFKFTTTVATSRASREDLARTIDDGIPGTYMPSFKLLTPDENLAIVEYVLWLSMRGELEYQLVGQLGTEYSKDAFKERVEGGETAEEIRGILKEAAETGELTDMVNGVADSMVEYWTTANHSDSVIHPTAKRQEATPESIARGRALYLSKDMNCVACHGEAARGDGPQVHAITKNNAGEDNPTPGLYDEWGNLVVPRDLTKGIYRGGRRPIDLFARLHGGIKGTPMPAFGGKKTDEELWDLVNYIMSVPFENRRPGDGAKESPVAATTPEVASNGVRQ